MRPPPRAMAQAQPQAVGELLLPRVEPAGHAIARHPRADERREVERDARHDRHEPADHPERHEDTRGGEQGGKLTGGFGRSLRAPLLSLFIGQRLTMLASKEHRSYLEALRPLIEAGRVTPTIDKTYPLAEVPAAMRHLEAGHVRGKIAITSNGHEPGPE